MLTTRPLIALEIEVDPPVVLGQVRGELRRYIPLRSGRVSGAIEGRVLPGHSDWQTVRADGVIEIAAHYMLERTDGARIEVSSIGVRAGRPEVLAALAKGERLPGSEYYFRTHIRFTTSADDLLYLNDVLAVSVGERRGNLVCLDVFAVL
jgi:hypothetical protein